MQWFIPVHPYCTDGAVRNPGGILFPCYDGGIAHYAVVVWFPPCRTDGVARNPVDISSCPSHFPFPCHPAQNMVRPSFPPFNLIQSSMFQSLIFYVKWQQSRRRCRSKDLINYYMHQFIGFNWNVQRLFPSPLSRAYGSRAPCAKVNLYERKIGSLSYT